MPSPFDLLVPGGIVVGTSGARPDIRVLPGGKGAADKLFAELSIGAIHVFVPHYPGTMKDLSAGGRVGYRPVSKSGPPTIDVDIPGIPITKIKFL